MNEREKKIRELVEDCKINELVDLIEQTEAEACAEVVAEIRERLESKKGYCVSNDMAYPHITKFDLDKILSDVESGGGER